MINNELKGLNCFLMLVRAVAGLLPLNQNSQKHGPTLIARFVLESSTVVYRIINNGIFARCIYRQNTDHVRIRSYGYGRIYIDTLYYCNVYIYSITL